MSDYTLTINYNENSKYQRFTLLISNGLTKIEKQITIYCVTSKHTNDILQEFNFATVNVGETATNINIAQLRDNINFINATMEQEHTLGIYFSIDKVKIQITHEYTTIGGVKIQTTDAILNTIVDMLNKIISNYDLCLNGYATGFLIEYCQAKEKKFEDFQKIKNFFLSPKADDKFKKKYMDVLLKYGKF